MIYFAQPVNGGPIRIGFTTKPEFRKKTLGTWLPGGVEFIHQIDGGIFGEAVLHRCFEPIRIERDWFRSCEPMWRFILEAKEKLPEWLPASEGQPQKLGFDDLVAEFGGVNIAADILGYKTPEAFRQAVNWQTGGAALASKVEFARLVRAGALPSYIVDLHARKDELEVAA